jgi:hypothetical protein
MVHLLSQLDPMVWLMMIVVAIGFVVAAVVLVDLLPGDGDEAPAAPTDPEAGRGVEPSSASRGGGERPLGRQEHI